MRILHTSDWHMNDKLERHERQPDLCARMEEIARILKDERIDVMLIAGDLFSDRSPRLPDICAAMSDFKAAFAPFLRAGGAIVSLSGNHDNEDLFKLFRTTQGLTEPTRGAGPGAGPGAPGRLYLINEPLVLSLTDAGGQIVQFAALPYPTPSFYLKKDETFSSAEERNRFLRDRALEYMQKLTATCKHELPSVLVAHVHIRNSELPRTAYKVDERDDVVLDPGLIPPSFAYTALGHIHKAQSVDGSPFIRYSGSIERMDAGERDDEKSVVVVEIGKEGASPPRVIPLDATPILDAEIAEPSDVQKLIDAHDESARRRAYLRYRLRCRGQDERALRQEVQRHFPRWYKAEVALTDGACSGATAVVSRARLRDTEGTTRDYIEGRIREPEERAAVLSRLGAILGDVEGRS